MLIFYFLVFMNTSKGPDVAATDIRLRLSPLVYSVNTRRRISEYQDDSDEHDKQTIYDEPHRPVAPAPMKHNSILKNKNKSCDMLCQYENFCIRDQGIVNMSNFGSTPLFNIFTVDQPVPRAPPPTSYSTTNFKDRYPAYDYSTPLRIDTHPKIAAASESDVSDTFYAASDILNVSRVLQRAAICSKMFKLSKFQIFRNSFCFPLIMESCQCIIYSTNKIGS